MDVDGLLKKTLEKLGVPVERLKFRGRTDCYITYQLVTGRNTNFSDDEEGAVEYTYQVHLYSKGNYISLLRSLKAALKTADFYGIEIEAEIFEQDTGFYHIPVTIKYMEV